MISPTSPGIPSSIAKSPSHLLLRRSPISESASDAKLNPRSRFPFFSFLASSWTCSSYWATEMRGSDEDVNVSTVIGGPRKTGDFGGCGACQLYACACRWPMRSLTELTEGRG